VQAVSKHLRVLEQAGLVRQGQDAQRRSRRLEPGALDATAEWVDNTAGRPRSASTDWATSCRSITREDHDHEQHQQLKELLER